MAGFVRIAAKFGIVGGTVYYTKTLGIWNDSSHSEQVYKDIYQLVSPYLQEIPVEVPEIPRVAEVTSTAKNYWNAGVLRTGKFLLELPNLTTSLVKDGYNTIQNQINSPSEKS